MSKLLIDYTLNSTDISNPDGSHATTAIDCNVTEGPGETVAGTFNKALDFGANGRIQTQLNAEKVNSQKFCARAIFKIDAPLDRRQNLMESNLLPFALFLSPTTTVDDFQVIVSVRPKDPGWGGTGTEHFISLKQDTWYVVDLVYDIDTVAVFINGKIQSVHAFPFGSIEMWDDDDLFIGTWTDGKGYHFEGQMAAVQLYDGIPYELEKQLDERRFHAEWYISRKYEMIQPEINLGHPTQKYEFDYWLQAYVQYYNRGLIMYYDGNGAAFEMHGAIYQYYKSYDRKNELGYLVSDEIDGATPGSRKSLFQKGGIYWSAQTGAAPIGGQMYLDYESQGESDWIGLPASEAKPVADGLELITENARMYYKDGDTNAHEVHGAILNKFLDTGGINEWGFPITNETKINKDNRKDIGRKSEFERGIIYWSPDTGAEEVHGGILDTYKKYNGPAGSLRFPTSDEEDIPGIGGWKRYNTFENGSILWFGHYDNVKVLCGEYQIYLERVVTEDSEVSGKGENDLYLYFKVRSNISDSRDNIDDYERVRLPRSGAFDNNYSHDFNYTHPATFIPDDPRKEITVEIEVWESDTGWPWDDNDHLGTYKKTLSIENAWGVKENQGVFEVGSFDKINAIKWAVQPKTDVSELTDDEKWWGVGNNKTPLIDYEKYAAAFRDVDISPEWYDPRDWIAQIFYLLAIDTLASNGNCFGMALEAINARKHTSLYSMPLSRFEDWEDLEDEFNIMHQYQLGAAFAWWFVLNVLDINSNPVGVFQKTREEFIRGNNPVLCLALNYTYTGGNHTVMPIRWNKINSNKWEIEINDPNFPDEIRSISVNPNDNSFYYFGGYDDNGDEIVYEGSEWSGGRLFYIPYSVLCHRPETLVSDLFLLATVGIMVLTSEAVETIAIETADGLNLNAFSDDGAASLRQGKKLKNSFIPFKGFSQDRKKTDSAAISKTEVFKDRLKAIVRDHRDDVSIPGELYLRANREPLVSAAKPVIQDSVVIGNMAIGDLMKDRRASKRLHFFKRVPGLLRGIRDRTFTHVLNDEKVRAELDSEALDEAEKLKNKSNDNRNFVHKMAGRKSGEYEYVIKYAMNQCKISASIEKDEKDSIRVEELGSSSNVITITTERDKTFKLELFNYIGIGEDSLNIKVDNIPVTTGKGLSLSMKPGLGGIEYLSPGNKATTNISIEAKLNGDTLKKSYKADFEDGLRIYPTTVLSNNELKVSWLGQLFGYPRKSKMLKPIN